MNDRELLELAAKAAGIKFHAYVDDPMWGTGINIGEVDVPLWNPLTDDGDAFRLSVKLRMEIDHNHPADDKPWVSVRAYPSRSCAIEEFDDEAQRPAATRRAIVRAAAEIGLQHK